MAHIVVDRISSGEARAAEALDVPTVAGIRVELGVGSGPDDPPDDGSFKPVYTLQIPVFALGALDSDGVHELDAAALLAHLQAHATQRRWAARLALELRQSPTSAAAAALTIDTDHEAAVKFAVADRDPRGTTVAGGARSVTLHSSLAHDTAGVLALGGKFELRATAEGRESAPRQLRLDLGRSEFQPR